MFVFLMNQTSKDTTDLCVGVISAQWEYEVSRKAAKANCLNEDVPCVNNDYIYIYGTQHNLWIKL